MIRSEGILRIGGMKKRAFLNQPKTLKTAQLIAMKRLTYFAGLCLGVLLMPLSPALGVAVPTINSVVVLYPSQQLDIRGSGFGTAPKVYFKSIRLTATYDEPNQKILANLGTIPPPGTYQLMVTRANGSNTTASVTLGAAGPEGPTGPQGPPGESESVVPALQQIDASLASLQAAIASVQANADANLATLQAAITTVQAHSDANVASLQSTIAQLQASVNAIAAKQDHSWFLTGLTLGNISIDNGGPAVLEAAFPFQEFEYGVKFLTREPQVFVLSTWNMGFRFANTVPYLKNDDSAQFSFGYTVYYHHTSDVFSDTSHWYQRYYEMNGTSPFIAWGGVHETNANGFEIWARRR